MTAAEETLDLTAWPPLKGVAAAHGLAVLEWAASPIQSNPRLCLVKGVRGSGKSHLLAWFLAGSASAPETAAHAMVPAEGLHPEPFAWELGRQLGYGPIPLDRLLARLEKDERPLLLVVADLHLAGRGKADQAEHSRRALWERVLRPCLSHPQVRMLVEIGEWKLPDDESTRLPRAVIDLGTTPYRPLAGTPLSESGSEVPLSADGRPRWDLASQQAREYALDEALSTDSHDRVRALLRDPGFLLYGSTVSISAALEDARLPVAPGLRETWQLAAPQLSDTEHDVTTRAALLHAAAAGAAPSLARFLLPLAERHACHARWARMGTHVGAFGARSAEAGSVLAAEPHGGVQQLSTATGEYVGALPLPLPRVRPRGIAVRTDGAMLVLDEATGLRAVVEGEGTAATVLGDIAAHHGYAALLRPDARATALSQCPVTGKAVVGDGEGAVHVWEVEQYRVSPTSQPLHLAPVLAVAPLTLESGTELVFSAGMDGAVRMWALGARPMPEPVEQRPVFATALAAAQTSYGPVLAVAWSDLALHLWHIENGDVRALPLLAECHAMAFDKDGDLTLAGPAGLWGLSIAYDRLWP